MESVRRFFLIIIGLAISAAILYASYPKNFKQYSVEDGLSHSLANCIYESSNGYIWIGTQDGLNRFDGIDFKVFRPEPFDTNSISGTDVNHIFEDSQKRLWIATTEGIDVFDFENQTFRKVYGNIGDGDLKFIEPVKGTVLVASPKGIYSYNKKHNRLNSLIDIGDKSMVINDFLISTKYAFICTDQGFYVFNKTDFLKYVKSNSLETKIKDSNLFLKDKEILSLFEDRSGNYWFGTRSRGLYFIDKEGFNNFNKKTDFETKNMHHYDLIDPYINYPSSINVFHQDKNNTMWIGTNNGLVQVDLSLGDTTFRRLFNEPYRLNHFNQNTIHQIFEDNKNNLWFTSNGNEGIYFYNIATRNMHIINQENTNGSLPTNKIREIIQDRTGTIWLTGVKEGICKYHYKLGFFENYTISGLTNDHPLNVYSINEVASDSALLLGTEQGLLYFNKHRGVYKQFKHSQNKDSGIGGNLVSAIEKISGDSIWIGFLDGQISLFIEDQEKFVNLRYDRQGKYFFDYFAVQDIQKDSFNNIFIASATQVVCLNTLTFNMQLIFDDELAKELGKGMTSLLLYPEDVLWIGTQKDGLLRYNLNNQHLEHYYYSVNNKKGLSSNKISCLHYDSSQHCIWIGTIGGGLNRFDLKSGRISYYTDKDGLDNNAIHGIIEDGDDRLWLSTNNGISLFDTEKQFFRNFYVQDGLLTNEFNPTAFYKTEDENIVFGGTEGITIIDPSAEIPGEEPSNAKITELWLDNGPVQIGKMYHGQVILRKSLHYQDTLFINHANNNFSLKYTSFYYPDPEHISYLYKLEGYQDEWKKLVHPYNMASFSNLPQGEYTLKLKLVTPHGKKSKITDEKTIIIFPPWYKTLWFKFLLVLLLVGTVFLINFIRTFQIRQRNRLLENLVKERTHEIEKEKEEIQQNFNQLALMNSESRENRIQASKTKNTDQEILEKMDLKLEGLSSEDHKFIMKLVKLISENLSDPELNINELASRMAMSRATLHNYIKRTTGKSASEFVRLYKIVSGATFLKKGYSISETLYFIGINSRSYFNKCFKEMYGQTPSQFIKNL